MFKCCGWRICGKSVSQNKHNAEALFERLSNQLGSSGGSGADSKNEDLPNKAVRAGDLGNMIKGLRWLRWCWCDPDADSGLHPILTLHHALLTLHHRPSATFEAFSTS